MPPDHSNNPMDFIRDQLNRIEINQATERQERQTDTRKLFEEVSELKVTTNVITDLKKDIDDLKKNAVRWDKISGSTKIAVTVISAGVIAFFTALYNGTIGHGGH